MGVQFKLDDAEVKQVKEEEVMAQHAYLLFYSCHTTREESLVAPLLNAVSSTPRGTQHRAATRASLALRCDGRASRASHPAMLQC